MECDIREIKMASHAFSTTSDYFETISSLPDTARHLRTAGSQKSLPVLVDILRSGYRSISDHDGSAIFDSTMVENVRVAVGIASPTLSVQTLFPLPVPWPTFGVFNVGRCRAMSAVPYLSRA